MKSDGCFFGLEIELAVRYEEFYALRSFVLSIPNIRWTCGTDNTAQLEGMKGVELRTTYPFLKVGFKDIFAEYNIILSWLIENAKGHFRVHNRCGIHIHFSDRLGFSPERLDYIKSFLTNRFQKCVKKQRKSYCLQDHGRYTLLRRVYPKHYEARIFNSSLKPRAIKNYFHQLCKAIDMCS